MTLCMALNLHSPLAGTASHAFIHSSASRVAPAWKEPFRGDKGEALRVLDIDIRFLWDIASAALAAVDTVIKQMKRQDSGKDESCAMARRM
jgi:hypothetical protein